MVYFREEGDCDYRVRLRVDAFGSLALRIGNRHGMTSRKSNWPFS